MSAVYDKLLLPSEVAAIFRVTKRTLWNWERRGILVPIRLPTGQKRYRREDVKALLAGHSKGSLPCKHSKAKEEGGNRCNGGAST